MPPSSTDTGNPRVPREASRARAADIYTTFRHSSRHSPPDYSESTYVKDETMCQINAMPNSANNTARIDDTGAEYYENGTHNRTQMRRQCSDNYDAITQSSDNYDAPSRNFCSPEPLTIGSLYPPANPFYYNAPPPSEVTAYYSSSITPPHIPQHFAPSQHCVTPPPSEVPMCYAIPPTPPPTEPPAYYRSMGSPPYEVPTHYAFSTNRVSSSPPPSEVPVYYPPSPTPPPAYQRATPISPPLSSPPPLIRTTRPPLQPPTLTDIPAPEWREVTPCYHHPTPPPAHLQNTQSLRPLLWRIESEGSMNLQIWDERTQDLATISFQSIVEALDEHRRKEAVGEALVEQYPHPVTYQQEEVVIQDDVVIEEIDTGKPISIIPSEQNIASEVPKENIEVQNSDKGKSQKLEGISMFIDNIDNVIADAENRVKDANSEFIPKLELKEEDESMEVSTSSGSPITGKVKLSNSERCRLFREKRLRKMKTNEAILKQLEKRNKILKETERMLIESKELSQKNCLKVMRGRGSL